MPRNALSRRATVQATHIHKCASSWSIVFFDVPSRTSTSVNHVVFFGHFRIGSHVTSTLLLSVGHSRWGLEAKLCLFIGSCQWPACILFASYTEHSSKSKPSSGQIFFFGQLPNSPASGKWKIASVPLLARELSACSFLFRFWSGQVNRHIGYESFGCSQRHLVNNTVYKCINADAWPMHCKHVVLLLLHCSNIIQYSRGR